MRYLQLTALTLLFTVLMSMCLMVDRAPTRQRWNGHTPEQNPGALPPALERQLFELREREGSSAPLPASSIPVPTVPRELPAALEQLRLLEIGARNMLLY